MSRQATGRVKTSSVRRRGESRRLAAYGPQPTEARRPRGISVVIRSRGTRAGLRCLRTPGSRARSGAGSGLVARDEGVRAVGRNEQTVAQELWRKVSGVFPDDVPSPASSLNAENFERSFSGANISP